jgi:hypothetical protein
MLIAGTVVRFDLLFNSRIFFATIIRSPGGVAGVAVLGKEEVKVKRKNSASEVCRNESS